MVALEIKRGTKPVGAFIGESHFVVSDDNGRSGPTGVCSVDRIAHGYNFPFNAIQLDFLTNQVDRRFVDDSLGLVPTNALQVLHSAIVAPALSAIQIIVFHGRQYSMEVSPW